MIPLFLRMNWKWAAPAALAIALGIFATVQTLRLSWLQTKFEKLTATIQLIDATTKQADEKYRATEQRWKIQTIEITKDRDDEIANINASRDALLVQLRNRPRRPTSPAAESSIDGQAASGCTGSSIYAQDAEFLIREAARADTIRAGLKACYAQFDEISD